MTYHKSLAVRISRLDRLKKIVSHYLLYNMFSLKNNLNSRLRDDLKYLNCFSKYMLFKNKNYDSSGIQKFVGKNRNLIQPLKFIIN
jgi:hypothetical protein